MARVTHREWVIDRNQRIRKMFKDLDSKRDLKSKFHDDPEAVAKQFGVGLSDEEIYGIRALRDSVSADNLIERLTMPNVAFFDANCNCPGPGPACW